LQASEQLENASVFAQTKPATQLFSNFGDKMPYRQKSGEAWPIGGQSFVFNF